ncbi:MAG TPA: hypothetical protein VF061_00250 [Gemmatimonadales bacterium]
MPSLGGSPIPWLYRLHMQQRTWVCRSRSPKYQCPLDQALHPTTSPRIQSGMNPPSTRRLVAETSWVTDHTSSVGAIMLN